MADIGSKIYSLNREQEERHTEETAQKLGLPYINLANYPLREDILNFVPEDKAIKNQVIPYLKVGKTLRIGAVEPNNENVKKFIEQYSKSTGLNFVVSLISKTSFLYGISFYKKMKEVKIEKEKSKETEKEENFADQINDLKSAADTLKNTSTTKLFDVIITSAIKTNASDVHLEPREKDFMIRFRIDGILQDVIVLPSIQFKQLSSRIKYLAKLRMDVKNKPQDGKIIYKAPGEESRIDLRISIMPTSWGESIVLRLLGQEESILTLDRLGFRSEALVAMRQAISKPYGMVLTSGPTGSGKTSTLYAIISELKKPGVKIITLENPVEYQIDGIEQSHVRPGGGYDFSDGLKASLRQDPDILMVGEIRDANTAEIAVQAALTGHLLLSTIHANSAPAVYARLLDIGVKPFLLSGSINIIMAQRLIRKICPHCLEEYTPRQETWPEVVKVLAPNESKLDAKIQEKLKAGEPTLVKGSGCGACNKTGFLGRQVIIEVLVPDEEIESLITKKASIAEFEKTARDQGMITMEQDGLIKVLNGSTTVEEVWRVTRS